MKRQATHCEKIFAKDIKGLLYRLRKDLSNSNSTETIHLTMNKILSRYCTKEDRGMANKHMKGCSASLVISEMLIKSTMRHYTTPHTT